MRRYAVVPVISFAFIALFIQCTPIEGSIEFLRGKVAKPVQPTLEEPPLAVSVRYTVAFDINGGEGEAPPAQEAEAGKTIFLPGSIGFSKADYIFSGWNTLANGMGDNFNVGSEFAVTRDSTLFAQWVKLSDAVVYRVTFMDDDNSMLSEIDVLSGTPASQPPISSRTGFVFDGWYSDAARTIAYSFNSIVSGDITLYARWEAIRLESFTVKYIANSGSEVPPDQSVVEGGLIDRPDNPVRSGYTFDGWYKEEGLTNPWDFEADTVSKDEFLYGKWEAVQPGQYTVRFIDNGGGPFVEDLAVQGDDLFGEPAIARDGYTFGGWFKDAACTADPWLFADDVVAGDISLYAKWNQAGYYTVNFLASGGTPAPAQRIVAFGGTTGQAGVSRQYYTFDGWYTESDYASEWNLADDKVTHNLNLYAKWYVSINQEMDWPGTYVLRNDGTFVLETEDFFNLKDIILDTLILVGGGGGGATGNANSYPPWSYTFNGVTYMWAGKGGDSYLNVDGNSFYIAEGGNVGGYGGNMFQMGSGGTGYRNGDGGNGGNGYGAPAGAGGAEYQTTGSYPERWGAINPGNGGSIHEGVHRGGAGYGGGGAGSAGTNNSNLKWNWHGGQGWGQGPASPGASGGNPDCGRGGGGGSGYVTENNDINIYGITELLIVVGKGGNAAGQGGSGGFGSTGAAGGGSGYAKIVGQIVARFSR